MTKTPQWFENYHSLLESRLENLEKSVVNNNNMIKKLMTNHLPHIDEKVDDIHDEMTECKVNIKWQKWTLGIAGAIISILLGVIAYLLQHFINLAT